jgi:hypothetical protein
MLLNEKTNNFKHLKHIVAKIFFKVKSFVLILQDI